MTGNGHPNSILRAGVLLTGCKVCKVAVTRPKVRPARILAPTPSLVVLGFIVKCACHERSWNVRTFACNGCEVRLQGIAGQRPYSVPNRRSTKLSPSLPPQIGSFACQYQHQRTLAGPRQSSKPAIEFDEISNKDPSVQQLTCLTDNYALPRIFARRKDLGTRT